MNPYRANCNACQFPTEGVRGRFSDDIQVSIAPTPTVNRSWVWPDNRPCLRPEIAPGHLASHVAWAVIAIKKYDST